jgi:hypothetical protein
VYRLAPRLLQTLVPSLQLVTILTRLPSLLTGSEGVSCSLGRSCPTLSLTFVSRLLDVESLQEIPAFCRLLAHGGLAGNHSHFHLLTVVVLQVRVPLAMLGLCCSKQVESTGAQLSPHCAMMMAWLVNIHTNLLSASTVWLSIRPYSGADNCPRSCPLDTWELFARAIP